MSNNSSSTVIQYGTEDDGRGYVRAVFPNTYTHNKVAGALMSTSFVDLRDLRGKVKVTDGELTVNVRPVAAFEMLKNKRDELRDSDPAANTHPTLQYDPKAHKLSVCLTDGSEVVVLPTNQPVPSAVWHWIEPVSNDLGIPEVDQNRMFLHMRQQKPTEEETDQEEESADADNVTVEVETEEVVVQEEPEQVSEAVVEEV